MTCFEQRQIVLEGGSSVSAVVALLEVRAADDAPAVILAHGAGNDMHSPFLSAIHEGLARCGYVTVKFNFPYKERGGRAPDHASILEACYARVLHTVRNDRRIACQRIVIGGKSLGGRIASHLAAYGEEVAGLLLLGCPLHPPRKPDRLRVAHLTNIRIPMLFFCGTREALCELPLLQQALACLSVRAGLHIIEGGDHSFKLPKSMQRDTTAVCAEITEASVHWLATLGK